MKFFDKILNKKNSKDKIDYTKLFGVIASRSNSLNDMFNGILPNPDLVLSRQGKGIEIYNELLYDPHVMSCVQSRKTAILSLEWDIYQNSKNRNKPDIEVNNLIRNIFSKLDLNNIVCEMLDAVLFGYKPFEIIWKEENGYIIPENVVGKPPQWFFFDNSNLLKFRQKDNPSGIYLPNKKFFVVKHLANYDNPYGTALLARCFWPVTFKKGGMKLWSIYTQKYGMPFLHGKIALGKGQEEAFELFNVLEKLQQDGIAVTEEEVNIDILESAKGSSADIYKNLLHFCNAEISKAILSQTLTTEQGDTGSYAMSQTHLQVRKDVVDSDKQLVEYWLNKLIEWIIDFNFESVSEMPKFVMYEEQDVDMTLAQRDQALASTNQIKSNSLKNISKEIMVLKMMKLRLHKPRNQFPHSAKMVIKNKNLLMILLNLMNLLKLY